MADIHILEAETRRAHDGSNRVALTVVYHLEISVPNYPGGTTKMSIGTGNGEITQVEADAIAAGTIYEHIISGDDAAFNLSAHTQQDIAQALRAKWTQFQTVAQDRLSDKYIAYGTTLARS